MQHVLLQGQAPGSASQLRQQLKYHSQSLTFKLQEVVSCKRSDMSSHAFVTVLHVQCLEESKGPFK